MEIGSFLRVILLIVLILSGGTAKRKSSFPKSARRITKNLRKNTIATGTNIYSVSWKASRFFILAKRKRARSFFKKFQMSLSWNFLLISGIIWHCNIIFWENFYIPKKRSFQMVLTPKSRKWNLLILIDLTDAFFIFDNFGTYGLWHYQRPMERAER